MSKIGTLDALRAILCVAAITSLRLILHLYRALVHVRINEKVPHWNCSEMKRRSQGRQIPEAPSLLSTATAL